MEYEKQVKALRCCAGANPPGTKCPFYDEYWCGNECLDKRLKDAATSIEELMAQVKDKDYLIQQQADEIERLRRDVKKQQEKMIELAKKLPKRSQWTNLRISAEGTSSVECVLCGATIHNGFTKEPNYCPNCGAMMVPVIVERKEEKA